MPTLTEETVRRIDAISARIEAGVPAIGNEDPFFRRLLTEYIPEIRAHLDLDLKTISRLVRTLDFIERHESLSIKKPAGDPFAKSILGAIADLIDVLDRVSKRDKPAAPP